MICQLGERHYALFSRSLDKNMEMPTPCNTFPMLLISTSHLNICALSKLILGCCKPFFTFCYICCIYVYVHTSYTYIQHHTIHTYIYDVRWLSRQHFPFCSTHIGQLVWDYFWMLHLSMYQWKSILFSKYNNSISYPLNRAIFNKLLISISHTWALLSLTTPSTIFKFNIY